MPQKALRPIKDKDIYHSLIEHEIKQLFDRLIFKPLLEIAKQKEIENAISNALTVALTQGTISYKEGYFTGAFNSKIGLEMRKLGATWNKARKAYYLPQNQVPFEIKTAIMKGNQLVQKKIAKINERLDYLQTTGSIEPINFSSQFSGILIDLEKQFNGEMPKDIAIPMTLTPFMQETIKKEYTENLNKYIQDFTVEESIKLREKVQEHVAQGFRASHLAGIIEAEQGVSYRKAKFLARQETSLMVASYRDSRYKEASIDEWIWSSSHDSRVRPLHRQLDGQKFSYAQLPVIDENTGERGTPGQAYGCRCRMIPLLSTDKYMKKGKNQDGGTRFTIVS